jgi:hypothetical protein
MMGIEMPEEPKHLPRTFLTCKRCGYHWRTNSIHVQPPKNCPACCSPYWDKDKKMHLTRQAKYRGDVVAAPIVTPSVTLAHTQIDTDEIELFGDDPR